MRINLQIDRLTLRGISLTEADRAELAASLQLELERLLTIESSSQPWQTLDGQEHLQAGEIRYQPGGSPIRLGREIAARLQSTLVNQKSVKP